MSADIMLRVYLHCIPMVRSALSMGPVILA